MAANDRAAPPGPAARSRLVERLRHTLGSVRFLMVASGAAFIVVVNGLIGYGIWQHYGEAMESARNRVQGLALALEADMVQTVFGIDQLFTDLSYALDILQDGRESGREEAGAVDPLDPLPHAQELHAHLRARRDAFPQILDLLVVDADGRIRHHSATPTPPDTNLADRQYLTIHKEHADTGLFIGAPIDSRIVPGRTAIPLSRRLDRPDGRFAGVLVALVSPDYLDSRFQTLRGRLDGSSTLALQDGTVLVHQPAGSSWPGERLEAWPALAAATSEQTATRVLADPNGENRYLVSIRQTPDYPLTIVGTEPLDVALAGWRRDALAWSLIGTAMTAAIALLTWFVVRQHRRREQDQEDLAQAARRIRGILNSMMDAVVTIDRQGRIETFNPAAEQMFGYREADILGRDVGLLIPDKFRPDHSRWISGYRAGRSSRIIGGDREVMALRSDGSTFPMTLAVSQLTIDGPAGQSGVFVGVIRDITLRKQKEAELLAAKSQAELANRAKSEFLANMSHELRTPLNAVIGFSEILDSEFFGTLNERQKACARDIHDSGKHLLDIVNAVLDMSKIEAGRYELNEEPLDPREAVAQCLTMVRDRAEEAGVTLATAGNGPAPVILADRRAFKQVLLNLLSNAVKFTPEGGRVTVADRIEEDGSLSLTVQDTGIGIGPDFMEQLFQPFRQADNSASRRYEGTGLGLSISKNFMELHGGALLCKSTPGDGTTMIVRLPASRVIPPAGKDTAAQKREKQEIRA